MTIAVICVGILALTICGATVWRIIREPRHTGYGMAVVACLFAVWLFIVLLVARLSAGDDVVDILTIGPIALATALLLGTGIFLIGNSAIVVRREGLRIATLVPAVIGGMLLTSIVATVAVVVGIAGERTVLVSVILLPLVMIPAVMWIVELVGYCAYALIYARVARPVTADAVVVLGAGLAGDRVTPLLAARIDRGIEALESIRAAGGDPVLVLSGGKGDDEVVSEAEAMARYAAEQGVPERLLIREDTSRTTEENLRNTVRVLERDGIAFDRLVVVTSNFHVLRSASLTRRLGIRAVAVGAPTATYYIWAAFLREFVACVVHYRKANLVVWAVLALLVWATVGALAYAGSRQQEVVDAAAVLLL
ncbi:YdcF family protein [Gordonia bronchialis]|uniref:YdcF family protein n=1 Tax=Gordonia bronchialis TaxID=2054 RepID=UPI002431E981|nr:YdcF family protein [Gordonia bronchialis]